MKVVKIIAILLLALGVANALYVLIAMLAFGFMNAQILVLQGVIGAACAVGIWAIARSMRPENARVPQPGEPGEGVRVLLLLGGSLLGAVGLFTGGCSLIFMLGGSVEPAIQVPGLLIALACLPLAVFLIKSAR